MSDSKNGVYHEKQVRIIVSTVGIRSKIGLNNTVFLFNSGNHEIKFN